MERQRLLAVTDSGDGWERIGLGGSRTTYSSAPLGTTNDRRCGPPAIWFVGSEGGAGGANALGVLVVDAALLVEDDTIELLGGLDGDELFEDVVKDAVWIAQ